MEGGEQNVMSMFPAGMCVSESGRGRMEGRKGGREARMEGERERERERERLLHCELI